MATNPVVSLPDADKVRRALARCELVVVSDVLERTDTTALAHVLLPAAAWGEKDGTVTNSERCISRQRAFLPLPGEAKPDWWIITQVARRMGHAQAFPYRSGHEIFREHAALSAHRNSDAELPRDFNLAAVVDLAEPDYDALEPFYWPALPGRASARMFGDGRFYHADRKARLIPLLPRAPANPPDDEYPLVLNTGRLRDQWHTMTRTGKAPRLASHQPEPYVEIHPKDAMLLGVQEGRLARVATRWGACVVRVRAEPGVPRRHLFVPIHWNDQTASDARVGALVNPVVDPVSGEPEFKHTPVRIEPFLVDWHGFLLLRQAPAPQALEAITWWTRVQGEGCVRYELAGRGAPEDWSGFAQSFLGATQEEIDWLEASDVAAGMYRAAYLVDDRLEACLFVSPRIESLPGRAWLSSLFLKRNVTEAERAALLAGQPGQPQADAGATICSCFGVGRNRILRGIREEGLATVAALGAALKCGTNCGSCVPELGALVAAVRAEPA